MVPERQAPAVGAQLFRVGAGAARGAGRVPGRAACRGQQLGGWQGGGKGAKGRKAETWDRGDLDDTLRVSVASSSSFNDSAPGSMATPVTPPPRAATMPPVQTRAP